MSRECYHCHQLIASGLSEDLMDAWERLRETAADFGEQRIYASHHSTSFKRIRRIGSPASTNFNRIHISFRARDFLVALGCIPGKGRQDDGGLL
jgi:hypothetical protein